MSIIFFNAPNWPSVLNFYIRRWCFCVFSYFKSPFITQLNFWYFRPQPPCKLLILQWISHSLKNDVMFCQLTGLAMLIMVFFLPNLPALAAHKEPLLNTWLRQDWIGTFLSAVGVFSLLAGLQWGGDTQSWNTPGVIASIVVVREYKPWSTAINIKRSTIGIPSSRSFCRMGDTSGSWGNPSC